MASLLLAVEWSKHSELMHLCNNINQFSVNIGNSPRSPPSRCMLNRLDATTPSLIRMRCLALLPIRAASASAHAGVSKASMAFTRFCCLTRSSSSLISSSLRSFVQSDLIRFTMIRVPSLLIATVSERLTRASNWDRPVEGGSWLSTGSSIKLQELSAARRQLF